MTGRFSSPEHALFQAGRNANAGGVPLSTASFKLNLHQSSTSVLKQERGDPADITVDYTGGAARESAQKPASFLDSNRITVPSSQHPQPNAIAGGILGQEELQIEKRLLIAGGNDTLNSMKDEERKDSSGGHGRNQNSLVSPAKKKPPVNSTSQPAAKKGAKNATKNKSAAKPQRSDNQQNQRLNTEAKTLEHDYEEGGSGAVFNQDAGSLELKKQPHSANMNLISYQTASFGANGQTKPVATEVNHNEMMSQEKEEDSNDEGAEEAAGKQQKQEANAKESNDNQHMFASMSDLNFVAAPAAQNNNSNTSGSSKKFQSTSIGGPTVDHLQDDQDGNKMAPQKEEEGHGQKVSIKDQDTASLGGEVGQPEEGNVAKSIGDGEKPTLPKLGHLRSTSAPHVSIITADQRLKMSDASNHWKVRTSTIDEIHIAIQNCIETNPERILHEAESLLEFFVSLLSDQNFKIVLMTLSIVNLVISMPQHLELTTDESNKMSQSIHQQDKEESYLSSASLGKHIPRLVGKLADSKNIIRQQAIRALIGIYLIMRTQSNQASLQKPTSSPLAAIKGQKGGQNAASQNNFVPLVLPYLCNSSSWHVREELLNVLVICFLKSKNIEAYGNSVYEFDQYKILEVLLQMLDDSKERIRFTALEAIVAFVSIGNKLSAQEIIYQLGDNSISELIKERLKAPPEMSPYLNENGALELPYLENVEIANQMQVDQILQRRQGLNSGPAGQIKSLSSHPMKNLKRGNSSGRKGQVAPPSANSIANAAHIAAGNKRTASANNPKFPDHSQYQGTGVGDNNGQSVPLQLHAQLGHSATQAKKAMHSPLFNVVGGAAVGQAATTTAQSDFGQSFSQAQNQYGNSFRQGHQRSSNERVGSGSSSFLPQLHKQNSVRGGAPSTQETPSHVMYSPHAQIQVYGASAGPLQSPGGNGLHNMVMRGQPTSENRIYSQHGKAGAGGSSFYQHGQSTNQYTRKVSANSQHHPSHLLSRGSDGSTGIGQTNAGTTGGMHNHQQVQLQNNLSNHPIHVLKHGRGSQQSEGVTSPQLPPGSHIISNDRHMLSMEGSSHQSEIGYLAIQQAGNVPPFIDQQSEGTGNYVGGGRQPPGYYQQQKVSGVQQLPGATSTFQQSQQANQSQQKNLYESQTQSSYYSRKNTHSQGSYTQQSTNPSMIYSQQNSNSRVGGAGGAPQRYPGGAINSGGGPDQQNQMPLSSGSMGEGPLQVTPQRIGQPHPASQNKVVRNGNTFYSDGSMRTNTTQSTSNHMANRLKQKQQMKLQVGGGNLGVGKGQFAAATASQNHLIAAVATQDGETGGNSPDEKGAANNVLGVQRGPIKATRQALIKKDDSQRSLGGAGNGANSKLAALQKGGAPSQAADAQAMGLYIDSRKPKRPLGSDSYQIEAPNVEMNDFMNNYQLPPKNAADTQYRNPPNGTFGNQQDSRKSNITILSSDAQVHPSGINSELAGNVRSAYGSKQDLTELEIGLQSTANKNYLKTDELTPIAPNPQKVFKQALQDLVTSADWNVQFDACNEVRRVCKFHQDLILQHGATLHSLVKQLTKLSDSLRSSLSKIALMTIRDMFQFLKRCMETYLDPLVKILLKRGSDTSGFISEEAEAALLTMTVECSDSKVLSCLLTQQTASKSNLQRLRICQCLCQLVATMGNNILFFKDSDKLISQLANYLKDACQEVRAYSKKAFLMMSHAVMGQNDLEKLLQRVLNEAQYKKVRGFLDTEAQHPSDFLSNISLTRQSDFVIRTAKNQNSSQVQLNINNVASGTPTSGLMGAGGMVGTPSSIQGSHVALGQNATKQMRAQGAAKGTLRTGPMHKNNARDGGQMMTHSASGKVIQATGGHYPQQIQSRQDAEALKSGLSVQSAFTSAGQQQSSQGDLNIKATQIVNPQKIVRISGRPNLKMKAPGQQASSASLKGSEQQQVSQTELHQQFTDAVKEIALKVQVQDWRVRIEQVEALFSLISDNVVLFQSQQKPSKMSELTDSICKLIGDQNAKIQLNTLERFQTLLQSIRSYVEANLVQLFTQLCQCLASMNGSVRKAGEATLCLLYENVNRGLLVQPICNEIQFSQSARLKPMLIDHLSDYVSDNCSMGQINKLVLPLAYKMLDDSRSEMKQKTEKLVKKLYFLVGHQVIDMCPQNKLKRVQDLVVNESAGGGGSGGNAASNTGTSFAAGGGTFGAVGAANLILQNQQAASAQTSQNPNTQVGAIGHQTKSSTTNGNH